MVNPNHQYGLSHSWGTCPHVVKVTGEIIPATNTEASCKITKQAYFTDAVNNGYTVSYSDPLFEGSLKTQSFGADGKPN